MENLQALVSAAQHGDQAAFGRLIERFHAMALAVAYRMLGDWHLAEDTVQEAWLEVYLWLPRLRQPAAFPAWLRLILAKHADRIIRRQHVRMLSLADVHEIAALEQDPLGVVEGREMQRLVQAALATLSEAQRQVVVLFYLGHYPQAEIAAMLGVPLTAVKKRLYDARQRLRSALDRPCDSRPSLQRAPCMRLIQPDRERNAHTLSMRTGREQTLDERSKPRIIPFGMGFVSMETGKYYQRAADGKLAVIEIWPKWKRIALAQGVDLETLHDSDPILRLAAYYRVQLSLETAQWMANQYPRTEEICALLVALSRVQALKCIPDGQLYDDHVTYLWAASSGLITEPAWAYQMAQRIEARNAT